MAEVAGMAQQLLDQQPAQTVADEHDWPATDPVEFELMQDIGRPVGQWHGVPFPGRGIDRIPQGPDADRRHVFSQPGGPEGVRAILGVPGGAGIAVETVDEDNVGDAVGVIATADFLQAVHFRASQAECGRFFGL